MKAAPALVWVAAAACAVSAVLWAPTQLWPQVPAPGGVYGRALPQPTAGASAVASPGSLPVPREAMNTEHVPGTAATATATVVAGAGLPTGGGAPVATAPVSDEASAQAACDVLLPRLPSVSRAQCLAARLQPSGAESGQGVPLYWRDVVPNAVLNAAPNAAPSAVSNTGALAPVDDAPPLRVLVVGAMHGDELTAASLALRWIALAGGEGSGRAAPLPPVHWRFIPVLNPDGLLAPKPTRVNASGVDLNRNFPTPGWAQDAPVYWEKRTRKDPRRWPGHTPLSEPESRFLHQQIEQFQPQLVVSIHAPYWVLDFDGPHDPPARLGRLRMDKLGVFPGSLGHYGGLHRGVPVVTIELEHALRMPPDAEVRAMWRDLREWMNTRLRDSDDAVAGVVRAESPGLAR